MVSYLHSASGSKKSITDQTEARFCTKIPNICTIFNYLPRCDGHHNFDMFITIIYQLTKLCHGNDIKILKIYFYNKAFFFYSNLN